MKKQREERTNHWVGKKRFLTEAQTESMSPQSLKEKNKMIPEQSKAS